MQVAPPSTKHSLCQMPRVFVENRRVLPSGYQVGSSDGSWVYSRIGKKWSK